MESSCVSAKVSLLWTNRVRTEMKAIKGTVVACSCCCCCTRRCGSSMAASARWQLAHDHHPCVQMCVPTHAHGLAGRSGRRQRQVRRKAFTTTVTRRLQTDFATMILPGEGRTRWPTKKRQTVRNYPVLQIRIRTTAD